MDFITSKELIANVKDDFGIMSGSWDRRLMRWAYEAVSRIGWGRIYIKNARLKIKDFVVELPSDCVAPKVILLVDQQGNCVEPLILDNLSCCEGNVDNCNPTYTVSQQLDKLCFSSNVIPKFKEVSLEYYSLLVDEQGNPLIPRLLIDAVYDYINYRYVDKQRKQGRNMLNNNPITRIEVADAKRNWLISRKKALGRIMGPGSFQEAVQSGNKFIYEVSNSMPRNIWSSCQNYYGRICS